METFAPPLPAAQLDNVVTIDARWAAKILSGLKTIEVRTSPPPSYQDGWYGIGVTGVPDLVVGRVRVATHSELLSIEQIAEKRSETQIPDQELARYLGCRRAGRCWYLAAPGALAEPVVYWSDGQTTKGAPRLRRQAGAERQILQDPCLVLPTEAELLAQYAALRQLQKNNSKERETIKAELFRDERAQSQAKRAARKPRMPARSPPPARASRKRKKSK